MSKRSKRQTLTVRVEYEPNRLSRECLQQTYQIFDPTVAVSLGKALNPEESESDQGNESDTVQPSRKPQ